MTAISVLESGFRDDLVEAHRAVAESVCRPGTWWDGQERRAIALEVRTASTHHDLPPWEAPSQVEGLIADDHVLPEAAIDAVWRITKWTSYRSRSATPVPASPRLSGSKARPSPPIGFRPHRSRAPTC
jgi:hypothetical protein